MANEQVGLLMFYNIKFDDRMDKWLENLTTKLEVLDKKTQGKAIKISTKINDRQVNTYDMKEAATIYNTNTVSVSDQIDRRQDTERKKQSNNKTCKLRCWIIKH
ncbi:hypothetical protein MSG28_011654 [Choristoneura fumiferana]|uniref:Uncharacterized protein n=1 Tax=Choristoneura fumiferana TaxID=7141 RepID=A0ACC0KLW5_CHOFU|nr:hypothetical protein MSG28_011654 [Choristoneura fumiferana]